MWLEWLIIYFALCSLLHSVPGTMTSELDYHVPIYAVVDMTIILLLRKMETLMYIHAMLYGN